MASEYSITIQIAPPSLSPSFSPSPGHVAVIINTPTTQTYAGFGPNPKDQWAPAYSENPLFDVQIVPRDASPIIGTHSDPNYANVFSHPDYSTFTIPVAKEQVDAALAEIARLGLSHGSYNFGFGSINVCSSIINHILTAAGIDRVTCTPDCPRL